MLPKVTSKSRSDGDDFHYVLPEIISTMVVVLPLLLMVVRHRWKAEEVRAIEVNDGG